MSYLFEILIIFLFEKEKFKKTVGRQGFIKYKKKCCHGNKKVIRQQSTEKGKNPQLRWG